MDIFLKISFTNSKIYYKEVTNLKNQVEFLVFRPEMATNRIIKSIRVSFQSVEFLVPNIFN
jgi:hypothetical protein